MITDESAAAIVDLVTPVIHNDETSATIALTSLMGDPMAMGQTFVALVELAALVIVADLRIDGSTRENVAIWVDGIRADKIPST